MIYLPVRRVFNFVSTPENDFRWQYGTLATARLSEGVRIGTFFRSIGHWMGRRLQGTLVVTKYEPNKKYGFKFLSGPLHVQTYYRFVVVNGGTQINISTRASVVNFFQMDESVLEKAMKEQLKENLALLKDLLEVPPILPA
jgi:hypothetical protein